MVALRFTEAMYQAVDRNLKTQTRRPLTEGNCQLSIAGAQLANLVLSSGRPDLGWPVTSLRCRMETPGGGRRSVVVAPRIKANTVLWPRRGQKGEAAKRENARFLMLVTAVAAVRLNDISEEDALAEGVRVFCPPEIEAATAQPAAVLEAAYAFQLEHLGGKTRVAAWLAGAKHREVRARGHVTARDCFALLWESINGQGSWSANPWVWRYKFRKVAPPGASEAGA